MLDAKGRLCGYRFAAVVEESGAETPWAGPGFASTLEADGLRRITERRIAAVPVLASAFHIDALAEIASPNTVPVLDAAHLSPATLPAIREAAIAIRGAGMQIGIAFGNDHDAMPELAILADWLFFDLGSTPMRKLELLAKDEHLRGKSLCVRGVAHWGERDAMRACGYAYCMGPFLEQNVKTDPDGEIDPGRLRLMDILNKLRADAELTEVATSLKLDPGLIVRMLMYANSPAAGLTQKVTTIEQAILVLGRERLYRMLTMLLFSAASGGEADRALLEKALARARFMELAGEEMLAKPQCDELFLSGLLSYLEPLLKVPIHRILEKLAVAADVRCLLLRNEGPYAPYLMIALAMDRGGSIAQLAQRVGLSFEQASGRQLAATGWAVAAMQGA